MHLVYQIIELCELKGETLKKAHKIIDQFAERGLRSLAVSRQVSKGSNEFEFGAVTASHSFLSHIKLTV